jgi:MSHA pilin protein MshC
MDPLLPSRSRGFTLVELVVVLVLMGIIGALAGSRLMTSKGFASRGFFDEAQAVIRYAQKTAIAWRRTIFVCVSAEEVSAISNSDCSTPTYVPHPVNPANPLRTQAAPNGVSLSVLSFSFDGMGRPNAVATTTITLTSTVAGDLPTRTINVAAETGYVY